MRPRITVSGIVLPLLSLVLLGGIGSRPVGAGDAAPLTPEQLVAVEKIRPRVEAILAGLRDPDPSTSSDRRFEDSVRDLVSLGSDVGPFMAAELDLPDVATFNIAAYVMGLVDAPGAAAALRKAAEVADKDGGAYGRARKVWAVYGLALLGDAEAVDRAQSGTTLVGWVEFMEGVRLLEVVSVLTAPESVPRLLEQLRRYDADETLHPELDVPLMALGAVGERSTVPVLIGFLKHARPQARAEAARSLGRIGDPSAVDALLAALRDSDPRVRAQAAIALDRIRPADRVKDLLSALEISDDPEVRGRLYSAVATTGGEPMLEVLRNNARRPNPIDRTLAAAAVGDLGSRKGLNLLRANLTDSSPDVVLTSMRSIGRIGGEGATDTLVALVGDRRPTVVQSAIEILTQIRAARGGPRIAERLLVDFLAAPVRDIEVKTLVEKSCEALVALRYAEPRADLRAAAAKQTDPAIVSMIVGTADLLDELAARRDDDAKWIEALGAKDEALRSLATSRLGELGTPRAIAALVAAYPKADAARAVEVLEALAGSRGGPEATALFEKIVTDTAWDVGDRRAERWWAAWGLRRAGGARAAAALKASAERRGGADWTVLLYYAQLAGPEALPVLRASRAPRLRALTWYRGEEQQQLETVIASLAAGRTIAELDVPPDRLDLH